MILRSLYFISILGLFFYGCKTSDQKNNTKQMDSFDYSAAWKKVEELERQGLPKTVFKNVSTIYENAKEYGNGEQLIKSLVYQGKYYIAVEEDGLITTIERFETNLDVLGQPEKSILQSMLAELYDIYLTQNLWKIGDRTSLADQADADIRNWTPGQFVDRSTILYEASVEWPGLAETQASAFTEILTQVEENAVLRNSLLDVLGHRAIDYFSLGKAFLSQSPDRFILSDPQLFSITDDFLAIDFSQQAQSRETRVLQLFQTLLETHLKNKEPKEVIDLELKRLNYTRKNFISASTDTWYEKALNDIKREFDGFQGIAEVNYYLAELYYSKGNQQKNENKPETNYLARAHSLCTSTITEFPDAYGTELCKSLLSRITNKELSINTEQVNLPGEHLIARISYKNILKVYSKVIRLDRNSYESLSTMKKDEISRFISSKPLLQEQEFLLPEADNFHSHAVEIAMDPLALGVYALVVSDHPKFDAKEGMVQLAPFFVSRLAYWHTNNEDGHQIFVVDRKTGQPQAGIGVKLYQWTYENRERRKELVFELTTDEQGMVTFSNAGNQGYNYVIELNSQDESLYYDSYIYAGRWTNTTQIREKVLFFLDRSIYRPGQIVYFKGLLVRETSEGIPEIIPLRKDIQVQLHDVNRQKLDEISLSTNEFGSFRGHFSLPENGLTGQFSLTTNQTRDRAYFNMESYKRPKFYVELEEYESPFQLGDKIVIDGHAKSYGGINISNAKVIYRVKRKSYFPFWRQYYRPNPYNTQPVEISNGILQTDEKGAFQIPVELLADDQIPGKHKPYFQYQIQAEVVDPTGETHSDKMFMQAGWSRLDIGLDAAAQQHVDSLLQVTISANNWNGKPQSLKGKLTIYQIKGPEKPFRERFWVQPDQWLYDKATFTAKLTDYSFEGEEDPKNWDQIAVVHEEMVNTEASKNYSFSVPVGHYKIEFEYEETPGKTIALDRYIKTFSDTQLPFGEVFKLSATSGEPGQQSTIRLQSTRIEQPMLIELFDRQGTQRSDWEKPAPSFTFSFPIEEKHRGNFFVRTSFVRNNRFYTETKTIEVPWTNKELNFEYLSFRDKLKPGVEEKWIVKVTGEKKDVVLAEMLASMYDASLDAIKPHNWQENLYRTNYMRSRVNVFGFGMGRTRSFVDRSWNTWYYSAKSKEYRTINWFGLEQVPGYRIYREDVGVVADVPPQTREKMMTEKQAYSSGEPNAEEDAIMIRGAREKSGEMQDIDAAVVDQSQESAEILQQPVRTNLNETVFFYPQLKTDESGNVLIEFTMNEALTRWKFMGLAHSKDLKIGLTSKEIITQKELMIRPNVPRFVRLGDELFLSASVSNLSEQQLMCKATLQLFDAVTLEDVTDQFLIGNPIQSFDVSVDGNIGEKWKVNIPENSPALLQYKFIAQSGSFSDGEAGYIPVLTNRVLVTETLPMWIGGEEEKVYQFEVMENINDPGLTAHRFTLESTSNPVWYAIQAMPYIREYQNGNSIQLANALYANLLASEIVRQNPTIERIFTKWKTESNLEEGSLQSNLQKNEELKGILLRETPWLLEGLDEATQKKNIALLFDLNQVKQDKSQILGLLKNLQRYDGGFSWFPGGRSSEYLTLYVLSTLGKLQAKGIAVENEPGISRLIREGLRFCDEQLVNRYNKLLEDLAPDKPDPEIDYLNAGIVLYLYTRSMFKSYPLADEAREGNVFYSNQLRKHYVNKPIYLQGMMALTLNQQGNASAASMILKSVEERSIYKEELGRYWKQTPGYRWTEFPIETHALLTEAFHTIESNEELVQQLQIWLLKNKQTNRWKTARASIAAIHALLLNQQGTLIDDQHLEVKVGNTYIQPGMDESFFEAGKGYFKRQWAASDIDESLGSIELKNPNDHIAWGAAYWQYFQDIDQVESFENTPLKIQKELYKAVNTREGEKLVKLEDQEKIIPGQKLVIRLRIEVDRVMDFIRLDDQRAAALEPLDQISGYKWSGGLFYYEAPADTGTSFYIENLPRGVYMIEYPVRAVHSGNYVNGLATIQSMYAPEFSSHSEGGKIVVE